MQGDRTVLIEWHYGQYDVQVDYFLVSVNNAATRQTIQLFYLQNSTRKLEI